MILKQMTVAAKETAQKNTASVSGDAKKKSVSHLQEEGEEEEEMEEDEEEDEEEEEGGEEDEEDEETGEDDDEDGDEDEDDDEDGIPQTDGAAIQGRGKRAARGRKFLDSRSIASTSIRGAGCNENARVLKGGGKDGAESMRAEMMQEMEIFEGISQVDGVGDSEDEGGRNRLLLPGMLHHLPMMLSPGAQVRYCRVDECNVLFSSSPRAIAC